MFAPIVQSAAVLTSAASAHPHSSAATLLPLILLVLVFFFTTRARARRRGQGTPRPPGPGARPGRRPRSARQAMSSSANWESDTTPPNESPERASDT